MFRLYEKIKKKEISKIFRMYNICFIIIFCIIFESFNSKKKFLKKNYKIKKLLQNFYKKVRKDYLVCMKKKQK